AENYCQFIGENGVLSAGEGIHRPANSHANQKKKKQGPHDIFHALDRLSAAQKAKRDGNQQREEQHGLQMAELESHSRVHALRPRAASYACSADKRLSTPAVARKRVPRSEERRVGKEWRIGASENDLNRSGVVLSARVV